MDRFGKLSTWLASILGDAAPAAETDAAHERAAAALRAEYGLIIAESGTFPGARRWRQAELDLIAHTISLLGPTFYTPFLSTPIRMWIDRMPGGGGYGHHQLRVGEPGQDLSVLYRVFLHEATHASNELRGWPYELRYCTRPGLDWRQVGDAYVHPRQQGWPPQPGAWETLPVTSRDVSTAPGEDLAEMVRYFVHSVRNERAWLWPLDPSQPPLFLWDTSPTRFVFVRDIFLALPAEHPWYKRLSDEQEARAAANLAG